MKINIPIIYVLGFVFIVLKLCGAISWSWWLVLLPLYFFPALAMIVVFIFLAEKLFKVNNDARN